MSAPTMASLPPLDSHSALRTPSDYGYQPVFSAPDLAIRQAVDSAQTQWTEQFNQLQTYTRLLEAQLQQMSDGQKALQNQMVQMIFQQQQQQWQPQPQRKQGRPHPGKSMRAKKRKQAQAVLEQANSSSSEAASDADCPKAAPAPAASASTQHSPGGAEAAAAATVAAAESQAPGSTSPRLEVPEAAAPHKAAVTPHPPAVAVAVTSPAAAPSSPAGHAEQTDEGDWIDVGKQMPSSPTAGAPQSVPAAAMEDGNKSLVKAAVEEAMQAMKKELIETTQIAAKEALAATLAEGLQQHSQRTHRDIAAAFEAVGAEQAFKVQLAAFKEEMIQQLHAEQRHGLEALKDEQQKEATAIRAALTGNLARLDTLQKEQQSNFEKLRHDHQELGEAHKAANETLAATLAQQLENTHRDIAEAIQAVKQQQAEELSSAKVAFSDSIAALKVEMLEQVRSEKAVNKRKSDEAEAMKQALEAGLAALRQETSQLRAEQKRSLEAMMDLQRSEAQNVSTYFCENLATVRTKLEQEFQEMRQACTCLQATSSENFRTTPPRCRVLACWWRKVWRNPWKLESEKELAEPCLVTATTLREVKVEAAKALWRPSEPAQWERYLNDPYFQQLKDFSGSRSFVPSQEAEERKSLQVLGCGEASLVKVHFRAELRDGSWHHWWSYEVVA